MAGLDRPVLESAGYSYGYQARGGSRDRSDGKAVGGDVAHEVHEIRVEQVLCSGKGLSDLQEGSTG